MGKDKKSNTERIAVLTDTGSFISPEEAKKLGVYLLPLQIIDGDEGYEDLVDIQTQDIYKKLYNNVLLKTSLPNVFKINEIIKEIKEAGFDSIIAIPLTQGISSTSAVISITANELNIPISIIDTYTTCQIQNYIVKRVKELIDQKYSRNEIVTIINEQIKNSNSYILAKDINHLKRGGRLTPLAASLANIFKIYPILKMDELTQGKIDVFNKVRTSKKAKSMLVDATVKKINDSNYEVFVLHSDDYEGAKTLKEDLIKKDIPEKNIHIKEFNSVVAVHVGMKCLAIQHIKN